MGFYANSTYTPIDCDHRLIWNTGAFPKYCEFRIVYKDAEVYCESAFSTGEAPNCLSKQIGCGVTQEEVETKTGTIKLHKVAFKCLDPTPRVEELLLYK